MSDSTSKQRPPTYHTGFPFASLALLITAFASLLACTDFDRWHEQYQWLLEDWPWRLVWIFGGTGLIGALIGGAYLFVGGVNWRTRVLGPFAGVAAGFLCVLILLAPGTIWRTLFAIGVLLIFAVLIRIGSE